MSARSGWSVRAGPQHGGMTYSIVAEGLVKRFGMTRRSRLMVTWTVLVNGSVFSSQAWDEEVSGAEAGEGCFEEGFEHGEFLAREVELAAVAGDGAAERVEFHPGRAQDAGPDAVCAAGGYTPCRTAAA